MGVVRRRSNGTGKVDPRGVVNLHECADYAGKSNGVGAHLDAQIGEQLIEVAVVIAGSRRSRDVDFGPQVHHGEFWSGLLRRSVSTPPWPTPVRGDPSHQIIARGRWGEMSDRVGIHWSVPINAIHILANQIRVTSPPLHNSG
jgi:hypothetical protein